MFSMFKETLVGHLMSLRDIWQMGLMLNSPRHTSEACSFNAMAVSNWTPIKEKRVISYFGLTVPGFCETHKALVCQRVLGGGFFDWEIYSLWVEDTSRRITRENWAILDVAPVKSG